MRAFILLMIFLVSAPVGATDRKLVEFSTSMDFSEFEIVLQHLRNSEPGLAGEISKKLEAFKNSSVPSESQAFDLETTDGYIVLERDDEYAFVFAAFTTQRVRSNIDAAYEMGTRELGI